MAEIKIPLLFRGGGVTIAIITKLLSLFLLSSFGAYSLVLGRAQESPGLVGNCDLRLGVGVGDGSRS